MAIEIQGEAYDFKFTPFRVEMIEKAIGKSLVGAFVQSSGMMPLGELKTIFIQGLKKDGGGYILQKTGEQAFYQVIEDIGYGPLASMIFEAIERDCPFFFQEA